jgi:hypothetical protein
MKATIIKRLREPSTWAGLSVLGVVFGLPPGTVELVGQVIAGVAGLAAIFIPEAKT